MADRRTLLPRIDFTIDTTVKGPSVIPLVQKAMDIYAALQLQVNIALDKMQRPDLFVPVDGIPDIALQNAAVHVAMRSNNIVALRDFIKSPNLMALGIYAPLLLDIITFSGLASSDNAYTSAQRVTRPMGGFGPGNYPSPAQARPNLRTPGFASPHETRCDQQSTTLEGTPMIAPSTIRTGELGASRTPQLPPIRKPQGATSPTISVAAAPTKAGYVQRPTTVTSRPHNQTQENFSPVNSTVPVAQPGQTSPGTVPTQGIPTGGRAAGQQAPATPSNVPVRSLVKETIDVPEPLHDQPSGPSGGAFMMVPESSAVPESSSGGGGGGAAEADRKKTQKRNMWLGIGAGLIGITVVGGTIAVFAANRGA